MTRKHLPVFFALSTATVVMAMVVLFLASSGGVQWPMTELGPAVVQDSYLHAAPVLESPFGMIGDNPGGYPLHSGSPILGTARNDISEWINTAWSVDLGVLSPNLIPVTAALALFTAPVVLLLSLGRKSYGSSKTR